MRILVFQHLSVEHPGIFLDLWAGDGHEVCQVEIDAGEAIPSSLLEYDLLAVMGGPMDVWQEDVFPWLIGEKEAIRHWVKVLQRPYFGICLGHQLLAAALGGDVGLMSRPEVGIVEIQLTPAGQVDPLLSGLATTLQVFQWHGAEVVVLPDGAEILAANNHCPAQAIRWGNNAYGFQFHVELNSSTVRDWIAIPDTLRVLKALSGKPARSGLRTMLHLTSMDFALPPQC